MNAFYPLVGLNASYWLPRYTQPAVHTQRSSALPFASLTFDYASRNEITVSCTLLLSMSILAVVLITMGWFGHATDATEQC